MQSFELRMQFILALAAFFLIGCTYNRQNASWTCFKFFLSLFFSNYDRKTLFFYFFMTFMSINPFYMIESRIVLTKAFGGVTSHMTGGKIQFNSKNIVYMKVVNEALECMSIVCIAWNFFALNYISISEQGQVYFSVSWTNALSRMASQVEIHFYRIGNGFYLLCSDSCRPE